MEEMFEYTSVKEYFRDLESLIDSGNEQEIYEFVKNRYLTSWNNEDLFPRLYNYSLESIFNGILYNNYLCSYKQKLEMVEKYKFNVYEECADSLNRVKLECGVLSVEEVYEYATKGVYSKNAIKALNLNSEWIDKFLELNNHYLADILLECTDMSFEQFVIALKQSEIEKESLKIPDGCLSENRYAEYQIRRLYPFTEEQEKILKKYCEYNIFMYSLEVESTYDKIMSALSNKYKYQWDYNEIGEAIKKAKLDKKQQLEILKVAVENELMHSDIEYIAMGLLENSDFEVDTLIEMCRITSMQFNGIFGYSNLDKKFISRISNAKFTEEQREEFKKSKIYVALDAASLRNDFALDDYIDMFNNECSYTENAVRNIISRFVKKDNLKFDNKNELRLSELKYPLITYLLINSNNPNPDSKTIINYAKTPLDCFNVAKNSDEILMKMIRNATFTDEEFDEILLSANSFPKPTNQYLIKEIKTNPKNLSLFIENIPDEERSDYFAQSHKYNINLNWAITVNSGLISQAGISFERICKILNVLKQNETKIGNVEFNKAINKAKLTIPQLEELMELGVGISYIKEKLDKMKNGNSTDNKVKIKRDKREE